MSDPNPFEALRANNLTGAFFGTCAPITFEMQDGMPVMQIHDPNHPEVMPTLIGALLAMDALSQGIEPNALDDAAYVKAEAAAHAILEATIAALDQGAQQAGVMVVFDQKPDNGEADQWSI